MKAFERKNVCNLISLVAKEVAKESIADAEEDGVEKIELYDN